MACKSAHSLRAGIGSPLGLPLVIANVKSDHRAWLCALFNEDGCTLQLYTPYPSRSEIQTSYWSTRESASPLPLRSSRLVSSARLVLDPKNRAREHPSFPSPAHQDIHLPPTLYHSSSTIHTHQQEYSAVPSSIPLFLLLSPLLVCFLLFSPPPLFGTSPLGFSTGVGIVWDFWGDVCFWCAYVVCWIVHSALFVHTY